MLFISMDDFYNQAQATAPVTRQEEKCLAQQMAAGNRTARETIIRSRLPMVAGIIRRLSPDLHTLLTVYNCVSAVEKGVDSFNFTQSRKSLDHHLSRYLRQAVTKSIAQRR